ncbi:MAG: hypothetical protein HC893_00425, partial [Chloroflexaceae bacterium]|nr:hypothetical protein [Chloroflexaceae bacterium]
STCREIVWHRAPPPRRRVPEVLELVGLAEHARRQLSGFPKACCNASG